ncbi:MAG TPA: T9SS type A sorting domain-containing protein [Candidatus Krumholzibacteria bacterium]|nr:T9SS type A sorting domain-containing protein [Candidatus Krumholzibacteria bacterium]
MKTRLATRVAGAALLILAAVAATGAQAVEVFNTDFEGGLPAEFSAPGCNIESVQGYAGLGTVGNQFSGSFLRYSAQTLFETTLKIHNLPVHDEVSISFLLAVIDSWDGTELLKISIDGVEVFSHWFQIATGDASSYIAPPGGLLSSGTNLGFTGGSYYGRDRAYDMSVDSVFTVPHSADSLTVTWYLGAVSGGAAQNWQGGNDESWALENVRVSVTGGAPTGVGDTPGLTALTLRRNAPNPFQSTTTFSVWSPREAAAEVDVFDVRGRRVHREAATLAAGWQDLAFAAVDDRGRPLPSGVYFYRVRAAGETRTHKIVVAR